MRTHILWIAAPTLAIVLGLSQLGTGRFLRYFGLGALIGLGIVLFALASSRLLRLGKRVSEPEAMSKDE